MTGEPMAWQRPTEGEPRWPAALATLALIGLQLAQPKALALQPKLLLPAIELVLFVLLAAMNPMRINRESTLLRITSLSLIVVGTLATAGSVVLLVVRLLHHDRLDPQTLLVNGAMIWLTNVIVFALWYWEADRGGPAARANARREHPDFLFAQMTAPQLVHHDWEPQFGDYLYLSFTNSTAFSPTDTLPMTRWAKMTMMAQAATSFVTVLLVIARAVNTLG